MDRKHINRCGKWVMTLLGAALSLSILGCGSSGSDGGSSASSSGDVVELPVGTFSVAWKVPVASAETQVTRLALNEDKVFAYTSDGRLFWINRATGVIKTVGPVAMAGEKVFAPVTLRDRVVIPTERELKIYGLQGKHRYDIKLRYNASTGAVGEGTVVFLGIDHPSQGRITAIDTRQQPYDVSPLWELATGGQVTARPAIYQGALFAASRDGYVFAVRADTRAVLWPILDNGYFVTGGSVVADLSADKDGVFVASTDSKLYCINGLTGRIRWTYYSGETLKQDSAPVSVGNSVYIYVPNKGLVCIDKAGKAEIRQPKWVVPGGRAVLAIDNDMAYVQMSDNSIAGVLQSTGEVKMRSRRNDFVAFACNVNFQQQGTIFAATRDGTVMAITPVLKPGVVGEWVMVPVHQPAGL